MTNTDNIIDAFVQQFPLVSYQAGEIPFHHQIIHDHFLFIKTGCIKMSQLNTGGNVTTLHVFYPGSCVSLLSLEEKPVTYEFQTLTAVEAYKIPRSTFIDFLRQNPEVSYTFLLRVLKGLDGLLLRIHQSAAASAYQRVASLLIYFSQHFSEQNGQPTIQISLTHQDIAEWLGLSRENVSIQMKKLERAGLIRHQQHFIEIPKLESLQKLAQNFAR